MKHQRIGNFEVKFEGGRLRLLEHGDMHGYEWMNTGELEKAKQQFAIDKCEGYVLVGGLGLGYIVEELVKKPQVTKVTVVEISPEVKELVWGFLELRGKCNIVIKDIEDFLKTTKEKFDYIYLDITEDYEFAKRLRGLGEEIVRPDKVLIWQEGRLKQTEK